MFNRHRGYKNYHLVNPKGRGSGSFFFFWRKRSRKLKKRDFWNKPFRNPYFLKSRLPRRTKALKTKMGIGILAILGLIGLFLFHPYFNITDIKVSATEQIKTEDLNNLIQNALNKKRWWIINGRNIFTADLNKIEEEIRKSYSFEELKIKSKGWHALFLTIKEKEVKILLQNTIPQLNGEPKENYYLLDKEGKIIQAISSEEINNKPVYLNLLLLKFESAPKTAINEQIISPATLEFLFFLQKEIPEKTKIGLAYATLADEEGRVVHLFTTEGWKIIMDRQNDWGKQMQVLTVFLRDKIKGDRSKLHYIDVRYENRSYYQ